jgi:hypothetical protein
MFLRKLKVGMILYGLVTSLLSIYPKESKSTSNRVLIVAVFIIAKLWHQPRCPLMGGWKNKRDIFSQ